MNESPDRALDAVNAPTRPAKAWVANVSGMVVAAMLIAFPGAWLLDRDSNRGMASNLEHLSKDFGELKKHVHAFHIEPRFTLEDYRERVEPIVEDIEDLEIYVTKLESRVDAARGDMASLREQFARLANTLPYPFNAQWQNRILENSQAIASCGCLGPRNN